MPSTFTPVLQIEQPGDGEQEGFWGSTVNANMLRIENAVLASLAVDGGAAITATPPAGTRRITVPASGEILVEQFSGTVWATLFDSRTKQSGGTSFLPLAGGTMAGAIVLNANASAPLNPTTLQQMQAADAATLAASQAYADGLAGGTTTPPGTIVMTGRTTAPTGWIMCFGTDVSRATFSALFTAIGVAYGNGDGVATFTVPDFRGYFPRGNDNGRGVDTGRVLGTNQPDAFAAHTHINSQNGASPFNGTSTGGGFASINNAGNDGATSTGSAGSGTETRPRNLSVNFMIKT